MSIAVDSSGVISTGQPAALSSLVQITPSGNPAYLVLNGFDRNEYTGASPGTTGAFSGNGATLGFSLVDGDAREAGIVFQYQSATGRYYNTALGYLDQLTYRPSTSAGDVTDLSLFATSSLRTANRYADDALSLAQSDPGGYLGTVTVVTPSSGSPSSVSAQATPDGVAAVAESFVGQAWNMDGCWVLASTIAADAGASLPVQSTADMAGQANGEWFVAYDGPAGSSGDWQSMVREGDMIGFITGGGSGHITTCVSGAGSSAELVDNITLENGGGVILDAANDGFASDVSIQAPHAASQEWAGVQANSVVIYRLDTPVVTASSATLSLAANASASLSGLFSAADPAGKAVAEYQVYLANQNDALAIGGAAVAANSVASAATVGALSSVNVEGGAAGGADTIYVRAFNGSYWGDWQSLSVNAAAAPSTTPASPATIATSAAPISSASIAVYRFFDDADGTHFFTASTSERDGLLATRPDMTYEGVGMGALGAPGADSAAEAVYRFFDKLDGTHFFTASAAERDSLSSTRADLAFEGVAFYEDATPQAGDSAVYRFFDTVHGTHLYTQSASEQASILATRPDLRAEGIAFYAPKLA